MKNALDCAGKFLDLTEPCVMGVLNVTPDSFFDGGVHFTPELALNRALQMQLEGAAIIDVGGESTRPGAKEVSLEEELNRVIPVIELLSKELSIPISIDTQKPVVMKQAVAAGAGMINDVYALREKGALEVAADCDVPICIMHMQGEPRNMQYKPLYDDVVTDVILFLQQRVAILKQQGIGTEKILIDPGFGFGKTVKHNLLLLQRLGEFCKLGCPILVGLSRKSMIGGLLDREVGGRLPASIALAVIAVNNGANIIRAHDVQATVDALRIYRHVKLADADGDEIATNV